MADISCSAIIKQKNIDKIEHTDTDNYSTGFAISLGFV